MKKILVVYNPAKEQARKEAELLKIWLSQQKLKPIILPSNKTSLPKADICISLGGDGTILKIARMLAGMNVPVLGVNLGSLGFLAEIDQYEIKNMLVKALSGKLKINERAILDVQLKNRKGAKNFVAINDCVLKSGLSSRVILLKVNVNRELFADYLGDGLIISTPTGSTAYSLAAGGPIVEPHVPVFIIAPICPHTLSQRPAILSSNSVVEITIPEYKSNHDIILSVDGQNNMEILPGDKITVRKSKFKLKLLSNPNISYYNILRSKLNWGITNASRADD